MSNRKVIIDYDLMSSIDNINKALKFTVSKDLGLLKQRAMLLGYNVIQLQNSNAFDNLLILETDKDLYCITDTSFQLTPNAENLFRDTKFSSIDLTNVNTTGLFSMKNMFYNCKAREIKLESIDTHQVTNMEWVFADTSVKELNLSNFDTSNVKSMKGMFIGAQVDYLDLRNFDTHKVELMHYMFCDCNSKRIDISSFVTCNIPSCNKRDNADIFLDCKAEIIVNDTWLKSQVRKEQQK